MTPKGRYIVEKNIYCADGLKFSYEFKPMSITRRRREEATRKKEARAREKRLKEEEQRRIEETRRRREKNLFGMIL
mgnify:FL=1